MYQTFGKRTKKNSNLSIFRLSEEYFFLPLLKLDALQMRMEMRERLSLDLNELHMKWGKEYICEKGGKERDAEDGYEI